MPENQEALRTIFTNDGHVRTVVEAQSALF